MADLTLPDIVVSFLKERAESRFPAFEIAKWIFENHPEWCEEKKRKSEVIGNDDELIRQIRAEIGSQRLRIQKRHRQLKVTEGRPRLYYWTEKTEEAEIMEGENAATSQSIEGKSFLESDLYPMLSTYLRSEGVYSMRIDDRTSSNRRGPKGNQWLYPDLVGMEDLISEWESEVKDVVKEYFDRRAKLWSFEVKPTLNRSNVRKAFFQAVSNSSWANFGYLAAAEIANDAMSELRMLCSLHGIGLIRIEIDNPPESQILIPSRERTEVDWVTCNRIAGENRDFVEFLTRVRNFLRTDDPREKDWDIPEDV